MSSLYVHIPFCPSICAYCDFPKVIYQKEWAFSYLKALFEELNAYQGKRYDTIYVGGGTPTSLDDDDFESLLSLLSRYKKESTEWSVESNPDSLSDNKLSLCAKYGVNRISIGMESSIPRLLKLMDRTHSFSDVKEAVSRARAHGFSNLNADLIYALPSESEAELKEDIAALLSLSLPHISAYSLIVEKGTAFYHRGYHESDDEIAGKQYQMILSTLREAGYRRYEVSNYAKIGYECKHNLAYWEDRHYDAVGLGASGYQGNIRYTNTKSLTRYNHGFYRSEEEKITQKDDLEYFFLTNLRLEQGFSLDAFEKRFGFSFLSQYRNEFDRLSKQGLLLIDQDRIRPTDQGILLLDRVLLTLFP